MKLRNKKTGETGDIAQTSADCIIVYYPIVDGVAINPQKRAIYTSLDQLNEEWEDYEEPKDVWWLDNEGFVNHASSIDEDYFEKNKEIGNYFETKEEAEKVVEKLKAWKRLKDKWFEFVGYRYGGSAVPLIEFTYESGAEKQDQFKADLDLLFGGKE